MQRNRAVIRFHLDENVDHAIVHGLRLRGLDVPTATDANLIGASDAEHIRHTCDIAPVAHTQGNTASEFRSMGQVNRVR